MCLDIHIILTQGDEHNYKYLINNLSIKKLPNLQPNDCLHIDRLMYLSYKYTDLQIKLFALCQSSDVMFLLNNFHIAKLDNTYINDIFISLLSRKDINVVYVLKFLDKCSSKLDIIKIYSNLSVNISSIHKHFKSKNYIKNDVIPKPIVPVLYIFKGITFNLNENITLTNTLKEILHTDENIMLVRDIYLSKYFGNLEGFHDVQDIDKIMINNTMEYQIHSDVYICCYYSIKQLLDYMLSKYLKN